jgi:hypothetical protein
MANGAEESLRRSLQANLANPQGTEETMKMNERVSELAAALWRSAGRTNGSDLDYWLMAEAMVRQDVEWRGRRRA